MITRFSKLKGFNNILGGRDLANIFKDGHVYQVTELMGEIMIKDLGEHAKLRSQPMTFYQIMMEGSYLLTKEEAKRNEKD